MRNFLMALCILVLLCSLNYAANITVAKTDGDYDTIQAALNAAGPGDTITVRAGTYNEKISFPLGGNSSAGYISLQSYTGETVIIDGQGVSGSNLVLIASKSYIKINGFDLRNNLNVNDGSGIRITGSGDRLEIENCTIHNIRGSDAMGITVYGTSSSTALTNIVVKNNMIYDCDPAHSEALVLNGNINGFEVSGNTVHDVNNIGIDFIGGESDAGVARNGSCSGNTVYNARSNYGGGYGAGIYVDGGQDIIIENNTVYECDLGIEIGAENNGTNTTGITVRSNLVYNNDKTGIVFGGYDASVGRTNNCFFYNNVLYQNDTMHEGNGEIWIQYGQNNVIKNNIVYCDSQNLALNSGSGGVNNTLDYNLWYGTAGESGVSFVWQGTEYTSWQAYKNASGQDGNSLFSDPLFTNATAKNFHLTLASPAVDAGDPSYSADASEVDMDGQDRVLNGRVEMGADEMGLPTVTAPNGGENWAANSSHSITWTSSETSGNVLIRYSTDTGANWTTISSSTTNDGSYQWTLPSGTSTTCLVSVAYVDNTSYADSSNAVFTISSGGGPQAQMQLSRNAFSFAVSGSMQTAVQNFFISPVAGGALTWTVSSDHAWLSASPTSGSAGGNVSLWVNPDGLAIGSYTGTLTVSGNASNAPLTVSVGLTVYASGASSEPFGDFSTPVDNADAFSSIPVTGWVLDDIQVESVKIYLELNNSLVYIGEALLVDGARPDVEAAYPQYPCNYKSGWGYMLLTNFLPNGGNGTFTLHAIATDAEGNGVTLGSKTINVNNIDAVKPFGAIDTPSQGGTASGNAFKNGGWVLTPQPKNIPADGSTISVYVNGVYKGHPEYGKFRPDIAELFPGYANSNGSSGYFYLDTTVYDNGVHNMHWLATDDEGEAEGIGSLYFIVDNTAGGTSSLRSHGDFNVMDSVNYRVDKDSRWLVKKGCAANAGSLRNSVDKSGTIALKIKQLERVEIHMNSVSNPAHRYAAYQVVGKAYRQLPIGSTFNEERGIFYWQPGPGFLGEFKMMLVNISARTRKMIRITVAPSK
ncbi:MAG: hypothetical protein GY765_13235 [bacterium]|nr:hypothetical protein [bacterium]